MVLLSCAGRGLRMFSREILSQMRIFQSKWHFHKLGNLLQNDILKNVNFENLKL